MTRQAEAARHTLELSAGEVPTPGTNSTPERRIRTGTYRGLLAIFEAGIPDSVNLPEYRRLVEAVFP